MKKFQTTRVSGLRQVNFVDKDCFGELMKFRFVMMPILLLALVACGRGTSSDKGDLQKTTSNSQTTSDDESISTAGYFDLKIERKVKLEKDFSNISEFKENLNKYNVSINSIGASYKEASVTCFKRGFHPDERPIAVNFNKLGDYARVAVSIKRTDESIVNFRCSISEMDKVIDEVKFSIPKSYVISGRQNFINIIGIEDVHTLLLEEGAILSLNGKSQKLNVKELYSQKGKVVTFFANEVNDTRINENGESGGEITLNVEKGFGDIAFELRGKNGGKQTRQLEKAAVGKPGINSDCSGRIEDRSRCHHGQKGGTGSKGLIGYTGFKGGDTGSLNLRIGSSKDFKIDVTYFPGIGSEGGAGGLGGDGGKGGNGSTAYFVMHDSPREDYKFHPGPTGDQGPQGDQGPKGQDGNILMSSVFSEDHNDNQTIVNNWNNQ